MYDRYTLLQFTFANWIFYDKNPRCVHLKFATQIFIAKIEVVRIQNCQLRFLPQKSELCAFQNLQLEFLPQKSELCAFQNLQLEFLPQKSELCAFHNLQLQFLLQKCELFCTEICNSDSVPQKSEL